MPRFVLFELAMLLTPFVLFGIYRMAVTDAKIEGKKAWPITALFGAGLGLAVLAWAFLILREDRSLACSEPAYTDPETGAIVPARNYKCDVEFEDLGVPQGESSATNDQSL